MDKGTAFILVLATSAMIAVSNQAINKPCEANKELFEMNKSQQQTLNQLLSDSAKANRESEKEYKDAKKNLSCK
jgi:Na+-transporting methylmalonyl-CoA/oxaloacetate decarboxylase gamma subunit